MRLPIYSIQIEGRHRRDLGDIDALAKSIAEIGLLQPVVVTREHRLIAGERRLAAVKQLKWEEVPVTIVSGFSEAKERLIAERDENTCRKDFTPSEAVAVSKALEPFFKKEADERKAAGQKAGGYAKHGLLDEKFSPSSQRKMATRDALGAAVGMSGPTLQRAKTVVALAESGDEAAIVAREEMDRTGKVTPAYEKATGVKTNGRSKRDAMLPGEKPVFKPDSAHKLNIANKNYQRLGILFGQTQAIADGIEAINLDAAMAVLKKDDALAWIEYAGRTVAALRELSKRLKTEADRVERSQVQEA